MTECMTCPITTEGWITTLILIGILMLIEGLIYWWLNKVKP